MGKIKKEGHDPRKHGGKDSSYPRGSRGGALKEKSPQK